MPLPTPTPLVISGAPRSGTTLLYNLFDGHPDVSWLVTEAYFFEYLHDVGVQRGWIYAALAAGGLDQLIAGIRDRDVLPRLHDNYRQVFAGTMQTAVEYRVKWDESAFRRELGTGGFASVQELWRTLSRACLSGLGQEERRFVCLKSPDYGKSAFAAVASLEDAKAIITLRDPLSAIDSLKYTRAKRNTKLLTWPTLAIVIGNYLSMLERLRAPASRILVVRHEDLLLDAEATMRKCADWLELPFDPCLLTPSFMGQAWTGHSSRRMTSGIDSSLVNEPPRHLTANEQRVIREALQKPLEPYGYDLRIQARDDAR